MLDNEKIPKKELIELCQKLVQTPSINGKNKEIDIANIIVDFVRKYGLDYEVLALEPERPCVLVKYGPKTPAGLLFIAHMDTVPIGISNEWNYPPFGGEIVNGRLYGRGAADNKGGLVAAISALIMLKANNVKLEKPVLLVCVPDEESGATGRLGIRYLHKLNKIAAFAAIYTYPSIDRIQIGHRGVLRLRIIAKGKSFHTGSIMWQESDKSYNSITGMAEIINKLEKLQFNDKKDCGYFKRFKTVITPTIISGGIGQSVTPDYCEATIDIRIVPTYTHDYVESKIKKVIDDVIKNRPKLVIKYVSEVFIPYTIIDTNAKIITVLQNIIYKVLDKKPKIMVSGPANESYILNSYGIPTCLIGPNGKGVHTSNEYVIVDSIFKVATIYALTAINISES